ncbi:unnamed protein product [Penicillium glandicola]
MYDEAMSPPVSDVEVASNGATRESQLVPTASVSARNVYIKSLEDRIISLEAQLAHANEMMAEAHDFSTTNLETSVSASSQGEEGPDLIAQVATSCIQPQSFSREFWGQNGLSLLQCLLSDPLASLLSKEKPDGFSLLEDVPDPLPPIPRREVASKLADIYFEHCNFYSPIISSKERFLNMIEPLYDERGFDRSLIVVHFRALVVFGTSILLLNRVDFSVPASKSERYFSAATRLFAQNPDLMCTGDKQHLVNLLFIIQYCCFASNITAAWYFLGLATRLAIELNLHRDMSSSETHIEQRWLFWALYIFERNLCVIIGRPFSFPDEAIETPLPTPSPDHPQQVLAIHLLKYRLLESEVYTTLKTIRPHSAFLNKDAWREGIKQRLHEWHSTVPPSYQSTHLAPTEMFNGCMYNTLVLLYFPSRHFPNPSSEHLIILSRAAISAIDCYKQTFRDGELRFFWRTIHNLFRSGVAIVYCAQPGPIDLIPGLSRENATASINSCSSLLWGMVERYPAGRAYRDVFDKLANSALSQRRLHNQDSVVFDGDPMSLLSEFSVDGDMLFPFNFDALL